MRLSWRLGTRIVAVALLSGAIHSAEIDYSWTADARRPQPPADLSSFTITRGVYDSEGGYGDAYYQYDGRVWARWQTDEPEAEENLGRRLGQLTRISIDPHHAYRSFDAKDLGDLPFLYTEDPGWMVLNKEEQAGLRRYLLNGGFMWVDDFWGDAEWRQFEERMREVLPELQWREIAPEHPIFHIVFDVNVMPQIPALPFAMRGGGTAEPPSAHKYSSPGSTDVPHLRGWYDDKGRLIIVATFNTDLGDGFEREAFGQWYFETFSTKAYMLGTNIITYALTH